ncbi:MAG: hypothetical protein ACXWP5_05890 [Bdellovibrionota bacterium]
MKFTSIVFGLLAITLLVGCASERTLQKVSSGQVGCAPDDVQIKDAESGIPYTWTAICKDAKFYCSALNHEYTCTAARK